MSQALDGAEPMRAGHFDDLRHEIVRLASLTTGAISAGTDALLEGDFAEAQAVIDDDDAVDALTHHIEDECLRLLARHPREPTNLRFLVTAMRVAHELERSADLMVNVAKTTWRVYPHELDATSRDIIRRLGRQAALQTRVATNAFADLDPASSAALADMDQTLDDLQAGLFRHILTSARSATVVAVQVALVARHYERIGDHAVTIAERVGFIVTGERARGATEPRRVATA